MVRHWWRLRGSVRGLALAGGTQRPGGGRHRSGGDHRGGREVRARSMDDPAPHPGAHRPDVAHRPPLPEVETASRPPWTDPRLPRLAPRVIVPIARMDRPSLEALRYARSISLDVTAVHVTDDRARIEGMQRRLDRVGRAGEARDPRVAVPGADRAAARLHRRGRGVRAGRPTTVVLAEFVPRHLWEFPLHNQTALRLKLRLFFRPNTVVVDVPFHLSARSAAGNRDARRVPDSARAAWREAALRSGRLNWLRGTDSNRRPSGYEPDELPLLHPAMEAAW